MTSFIGLMQKTVIIKVNLSDLKYSQKNSVINDCKRQNSLLNEQKGCIKVFSMTRYLNTFLFHHSFTTSIQPLSAIVT
jgi:hypothetical protein